MTFAMGISVAGGVACTIGERLRPARPLSYRNVALFDSAACVIYNLVILPLTFQVTSRLGHFSLLPSSVAQWPLAVRVTLFFVLGDLGAYWMHRLMHTRFVWRIHKWHHSPKYVYWFSHTRASVPQQVLFFLPGLLVLPLLSHAPAWVFLVVSAEGILLNHWMHWNLDWKSRWVEWIFVTPRYHHVHHSDDSRHHGSNLSGLFTIWDRIFGTHFDPDAVKEPLTFGTGEKDHVVRLIVGV